MIKDILIGDKTQSGVVYSMLITRAPENDVYLYRGVLVAGCHAVLEDNTWMRIRDSKNAENVPYSGPLVDIGVEGHEIHVAGVTFADLDEVDSQGQLEQTYDRMLNI